LTKPNILFLLIDAFIANRCYGENKSSKTPNIDYLIKNGTYFDEALSSSDDTSMSLASIFSGFYSFKSMERKSKWVFKFNPDVTNYITILKQNGYHTYAIMPKLKLLEEFITPFENNVETYPYFGYRLFDGLGKKIVNKLESKNMKEPWFYYVHLEDVHKPISFPKEFDNDEFGNDDYDKTISSLDVWLGKFLKKTDLTNTLIVLTSDHGDYLRIVEHKGKRISFEYTGFAKSALDISKITPPILYGLKIRSFLFFRKIITQFKLARLGIKLSPYEKRALENARSSPKRYLYDELFHIPLIFSGYGIPSLGVIKQQARSVDIFPTIAEIAGLHNNDNIIHGRSLVPIFKGKKLDNLPVYLESGFNIISSKVVIGIRTQFYKYFRGLHKSGEKLHLYDLKNDPLEENNIANEKSEVVNQMEKILTEIRQDSKRLYNKVYENNEDDSKLKKDELKEVLKELKEIGYI